MKSFILSAAIVMGLATTASADVVELSSKVVTLNVDLSTTQVRLSNAGYTSPVLKVLVPELAGVTILDHRNEGEAAPCIATYESLDPEDVIQGNPSVEKVDLKITLSKGLYADVEAGTCRVTLHELVEGKIRGLGFTHSRLLDVGTRHIDDCQ
ncbi:MAG: hypothetical protein KDD37_10255 [Bdellovibrionales bacterium]|nr:hypothetical protein [Bdellovibrionales bacterium]